MQGSSQISLSRYRVTVDFYADDCHFGTETYSVTAASWYQAEQEALARSVDSAYDNDRVPGLRRRVHAVPA